MREPPPAPQTLWVSDPRGGSACVTPRRNLCCCRRCRHERASSRPFPGEPCRISCFPVLPSWFFLFFSQFSFLSPYKRALKQSQNPSRARFSCRHLLSAGVRVGSGIPGAQRGPGGVFLQVLLSLEEILLNLKSS